MIFTVFNDVFVEQLCEKSYTVTSKQRYNQIHSLERLENPSVKDLCESSLLNIRHGEKRHLYTHTYYIINRKAQNNTTVWLCFFLNKNVLYWRYVTGLFWCLSKSTSF